MVVNGLVFDILAPDRPGADSALYELFYHTEEIRFLYWRRMSGAKPTVLLVGLIAVVSFITGMSLLSQETIELAGPISAVVDVPESSARFGGVLFAFVLGVVVFGLNRRKRIAWLLAMGILPIMLLLPLITLQANDLPLLVLILISLPMLFLNRHRFDQPLELSPIQVASSGAIAGVLLYGTVGSYVMREGYAEIDTWTDALYYVIVTIATVGYGDATPLTQETKLFTLTFIIIGTAAWVAALGSILIPAIESRMAAAVGNMTSSDLKLHEDHVVILGYGELTEPILEELEDDIDVVVITENQAAAAELRESDISVLTADPTEEPVLLEAGIDLAHGVIVATEDDAHDVLAILAARQTAPDMYIVAAATDRYNIDKLRAVGADDVISPVTIGGQMIGRSVRSGRREEPEST